LPRVLVWKGYRLNPFQVQAVEAIQQGKNVLLSAPTGAGKTLVAEYAIDAAVRAGRRAIYTSPIKALSNQKYRDFKADSLPVGLMTGDLTLEAGSPLVIMTTEIFRNSVFEDPARFADVDFVIFDEVHFMDDPERGTVWEESLIFAPPHVRFVCLSATISNLKQFGSWLSSIRKHELAVIRHDRRPVPLAHELFHAAAGFFDLAQRRRALQQVESGRRRAGRKRGRRPGMRGRAPLTPRASRLVLDHLARQRLLPVLFFCFSRKECELKAANNLHRELLSRPELQQIGDLFTDICKKFELHEAKDPALQGIHMRALRGVGYHHAGMLPIHKEVVERLFTSGLLKLLFTTETFALGINMPARTVVFDSLRKFDGVAFDYMKSRDYLQMAGRAGRQGIDDEGLVISILDDDDVQDAPLAALFGGKVEPITSRFNLSYSTLLNLHQRLGTQLLDAYDRSFAAFQAQTGSQKLRERARAAAHATLLARLQVLRDAGYLGDDELLPRGRIAQQINGYEIQVTELLFDGVLEQMNMRELACTFCALVHEERRGDDGPARGREILGPLARRIEGAVRRFAAIETRQGFVATIKAPDFGIVPVVDAWSRGASITELQRMLSNDGGDAVRTMRMAIQMLRQLKGALSGDYPLIHRVSEAIVAINRDEVDAKRQFELG
jgi:superfamily II RNA helicase